MSDPGANVEHMDKLYLWRVSKSGHRVHIENPATERAYCQAENCGGEPFDGRDAEIPPGRRLCKNCTDLASRNETDYREPDVRVLMGERLAETGSDLFDGTVASKLWKRGKPARRPKATLTAHLRKPKRSNVKYARPFNDDLPW